MKADVKVNGTRSSLVCRHCLEGAIEMPKLCLFNHRCRNCAYDQWLEETGRVERSASVISTAAHSALWTRQIAAIPVGRTG